SPLTERLPFARELLGVTFLAVLVAMRGGAIVSPRSRRHARAGRSPRRRGQDAHRDAGGPVLRQAGEGSADLAEAGLPEHRRRAGTRRGPAPAAAARGARARRAAALRPCR